MEEESGRTVLWKLVGRIKTCMLVTHDDASIRSRPMRGREAPEDNAIWFFTDRSTSIEEEITEAPQVCLAYSDVNSNSYVSLSGHMESITDPRTIERLMDGDTEAYFPKGVADGSLTLLKFTPEFGECWDSPGNPVIIAIRFIEAKLMGTKPDLGTNQKIDFGQLPGSSLA